MKSKDAGEYYIKRYKICQKNLCTYFTKVAPHNCCLSEQFYVECHDNNWSDYEEDLKNNKGAKVIIISDDARIRATEERNIELEILRPVVKKDTGETVMTWKTKGYYTSIESCVKAYLDTADAKAALSEESISLKQFIQSREQLKQLIHSKLN